MSRGLSSQGGTRLPCCRHCRSPVDPSRKTSGDTFHPKQFRTNTGKVTVMNDDVKAPLTRPYSAPKRAAQAAATRRAVLEAARGLFVERGYSATAVSDIAARAGVSLDTVYASVGRKPVVLRELVETALSGADHAVVAQQRDYVLAI